MGNLLFKLLPSEGKDDHDDLTSVLCMSQVVMSINCSKIQNDLTGPITIELIYLLNPSLGFI